MVNELADFSNSWEVAVASLEGLLQPEVSCVKAAFRGRCAERGKSRIC